ncbi:MAG: hypothetical protein DRI56_13090 [Chloroflexota bacterium]|nr:MAG: hypothetical protein DRI56_13090 [Chloroflexota bacterium]
MVHLSEAVETRVSFLIGSWFAQTAYVAAGKGCSRTNGGLQAGAALTIRGFREEGLATSTRTYAVLQQRRESP